MVADILLGNKKNNIIRKLKDSWLERCMTVGSWIYLYRIFSVWEDFCIQNTVLVGILGLLIVNIMYVPERILQHRKIGVGMKIFVVLLVAVVAVYVLDGSFNSSVADIIENVIVGTIFIAVSVIGMIVVGNLWKVHAKTERNYQKWCDYNTMEGHEFEYFCADLLKQRGFHSVEVTQGSGDYGIDIIAWKSGKRYGIQCKRYSGSVGWSAVEEAHAGAVYYDCDKAVVITNSDFTKQAVQGAAKIGVELWGRDWIEAAI